MYIMNRIKEVAVGILKWCKLGRGRLESVIQDEVQAGGTPFGDSSDTQQLLKVKEFWKALSSEIRHKELVRVVVRCRRTRAM